MKARVEWVEGVPITTKRYIKFDDYLKEIHGLNGPGAGREILFIEDYIEFCERHNENTEPDFNPESRKYALTPKGRNLYDEVVELRAKLKEAKTAAEKQVISEQLVTIRGW